MRKPSTRQFALVGLALLGVLAGCWLVWRRQAKDVTPRPLPSPVRLSPGEQIAFDLKPLKGGDEYHFISGSGGTLWVLRQEMFQPLMAARLDKGVEEPAFEAISPENWTDVDRVSVSNDSSGHPIVFMMGFLRDARDTRVVARAFDGDAWGEPVLLDTFDGAGTFGSIMTSLLDSSGRVHVVYDRHLVPRESYGVMEGQFPDKCFHAWSDGESWTGSKATTGKGHFYVDPVALTELPDKRICLISEFRPFSSFGGHKPEFTGCQLWDGGRWSDVTRQLPEGAISTADTQPVSDYWGNVFSYSGQDGRHVCIVKKQGGESLESVELLSKPIILRDRSGMVIVCSSDSSRGELHLWSGRQWAGKISYPLQHGGTLSQILWNPDGSILVIHTRGSRVIAQRIRLVPGTADEVSQERDNVAP